jgi:hypothetical protein
MRLLPIALILYAASVNYPNSQLASFVMKKSGLLTRRAQMQTAELFPKLNEIKLMMLTRVYTFRREECLFELLNNRTSTEPVFKLQTPNSQS